MCWKRFWCISCPSSMLITISYTLILLFFQNCPRFLRDIFSFFNIFFFLNFIFEKLVYRRHLAIIKSCVTFLFSRVQKKQQSVSSHLQMACWHVTLAYWPSRVCLVLSHRSRQSDGKRKAWAETYIKNSQSKRKRISCKRAKGKNWGQIAIFVVNLFFFYFSIIIAKKQKKK